MIVDKKKLVGFILVLLTFNLFKDNFTTLNDRLRLNFTKKKRLTMIDGGDECAQNNMGDP